MRVELVIEGMSCPGCERTVSKIIEKNGGLVESVSAGKNRAAFSIPSVESLEKILREIEEKGYRVREVKKE